MAGAEPDPAPEIARLREENRALDEQVKLLVQTEQRLYRSQRQLDGQLVRLRALAGFDLDAASLEHPPEVLGRALEVLALSFELDWIAAVAAEPGSGRVTVLRVHEGSDPEPVSREVSPEGRAWLAGACRAPALAARGSAAGDAAVALVTALAPDAPAPHPSAHVASVPLRDAGNDRPGALIAYSARQRPAFQREGEIAPHHLPYLQLLAHHVDHATANARLTRSLREHAERLARSLETLERTQQELVHAQKMEAVGRLAGGVAHDFNNLLTVILGYAGTLGATLPADGPQQENVERILEAGRRAAKLTGQLLALGRRQMQRRENVDLSAQALQSAEFLRGLVGEHIQLQLDLDPMLPVVRADRTQIEQVVLNLVVNARDAMPNGGVMRIVSRRAMVRDAARCEAPIDPRAFAVLEVADNGSGMDEATRAQIFEPFYTTKAGRGSGLGLAVVYGIVRQSDGHVLVESRPGSGSCFTVLLPISSGADVVAAGERTRAPAGGLGPDAAPAGPAAATPSPATILVVEDEQVIRRIVASVLANAGHQVFEAVNGEHALARVLDEQLTPDLLLTDVVMPKIGGIKLAETLRRLRPGVRVAFMSGYSEDLLRDGGRPAGAEAFIAKPFAPRELLAFVAACLAAPVGGGRGAPGAGAGAAGPGMAGAH
jgi:signal transduction histidine kinase/CheY-like chemotaxis protein